MAADHAASTAQLEAVMHAHWILQLGIEAVESDSIAAMLAAAAVQIAAAADIQPHMGAALRPPKEDQIARAQQAVATRRYGHGLSEALLLVGIPR